MQTIGAFYTCMLTATIGSLEDSLPDLGPLGTTVHVPPAAARSTGHPTGSATARVVTAAGGLGQDISRQSVFNAAAL